MGWVPEPEPGVEQEPAPAGEVSARGEQAPVVAVRARASALESALALEWA